jgi:hypothetical protein
MSPVSHLWTCTLDGEFAGDGERVWAPTDEAKPSFDEEKLKQSQDCSLFSSLSDVDGFDETRA